MAKLHYRSISKRMVEALEVDRARRTRGWTLLGPGPNRILGGGDNSPQASIHFLSWLFLTHVEKISATVPCSDRWEKSGWPGRPLWDRHPENMLSWADSRKVFCYKAEIHRSSLVSARRGREEGA